MQTQPRPYEVSLEEYFLLEEGSDTKHEYIRGRVIAMAGGALNHNRIVSNAIRVVGNALSDSGCEVFPSDLRIQVVAANIYTYPDVSVICGKPELYKNRTDTVLNPRLLIEVLSPSTEAYDRGQKFIRYRLIPSLEEYVMITSNFFLVEVYRKVNMVHWELRTYESADSLVVLSSLGLTITAGDLYRNVVFEDEAEEVVGIPD